MSVKLNLAYGKHFQLYHRSDTVCIELEGFKFEMVSSRKITITLPPALWEFVRTLPGETDLAKLSDKALLGLAEKAVDERIAVWKRTPPQERRHVLDIWRLGFAGGPRKTQLRRELQQLFEKRNAQRKFA